MPQRHQSSSAHTTEVSGATVSGLLVCLSPARDTPSWVANASQELVALLSAHHPRWLLRALIEIIGWLDHSQDQQEQQLHDIIEAAATLASDVYGSDWPNSAAYDDVLALLLSAMGTAIEKGVKGEDTAAERRVLSLSRVCVAVLQRLGLQGHAEASHLHADIIMMCERTFLAECATAPTGVLHALLDVVEAGLVRAGGMLFCIHVGTRGTLTTQHVEDAVQFLVDVSEQCLFAPGERSKRHYERVIRLIRDVTILTRGDLGQLITTIVNDTLVPWFGCMAWHPEAAATLRAWVSETGLLSEAVSNDLLSTLPVALRTEVHEKCKEPAHLEDRARSSFDVEDAAPMDGAGNIMMLMEHLLTLRQTQTSIEDFESISEQTLGDAFEALIRDVHQLCYVTSEHSHRRLEKRIHSLGVIGCFAGRCRPANFVPLVASLIKQGLKGKKGGYAAQAASVLTFLSASGRCTEQLKSDSELTELIIAATSHEHPLVRAYAMRCIGEDPLGFGVDFFETAVSRLVAESTLPGTGSPAVGNAFDVVRNILAGVRSEHLELVDVAARADRDSEDDEIDVGDPKMDDSKQQVLQRTIHFVAEFHQLHFQRIVDAALHHIESPNLELRSRAGALLSVCAEMPVTGVDPSVWRVRCNSATKAIVALEQSKGREAQSPLLREATADIIVALDGRSDATLITDVVRSDYRWHSNPDFWRAPVLSAVGGFVRSYHACRSELTSDAVVVAGFDDVSQRLVALLKHILVAEQPPPGTPLAIAVAGCLRTLALGYFGLIEPILPIVVNFGLNAFAIQSPDLVPEETLPLFMRLGVIIRFPQTQDDGTVSYVTVAPETKGFDSFMTQSVSLLHDVLMKQVAARGTLMRPYLFDFAAALAGICDNDMGIGGSTQVVCSMMQQVIECAAGCLPPKLIAGLGASLITAWAAPHEWEESSDAAFISQGLEKVADIVRGAGATATFASLIAPSFRTTLRAALARVRNAVSEHRTLLRRKRELQDDGAESITSIDPEDEIPDESYSSSSASSTSVQLDSDGDGNSTGAQSGSNPQTQSVYGSSPGRTSIPGSTEEEASSCGDSGEVDSFDPDEAETGSDAEGTDGEESQIDGGDDADSDGGDFVDHDDDDDEDGDGDGMSSNDATSSQNPSADASHFEYDDGNARRLPPKVHRSEAEVAETLDQLRIELHDMEVIASSLPSLLALYMQLDSDAELRSILETSGYRRRRHRVGYRDNIESVFEYILEHLEHGSVKRADDHNFRELHGMDLVDDAIVYVTGSKEPLFIDGLPKHRSIRNQLLVNSMWWAAKEPAVARDWVQSPRRQETARYIVEVATEELALLRLSHESNGSQNCMSCLCELVLALAKHATPVQQQEWLPGLAVRDLAAVAAEMLESADAPARDWQPTAANAASLLVVLAVSRPTDLCGGKDSVAEGAQHWLSLLANSLPLRGDADEAKAVNGRIGAWFLCPVDGALEANLLALGAPELRRLIATRVSRSKNCDREVSAALDAIAATDDCQLPHDVGPCVADINAVHAVLAGATSTMFPGQYSQLRRLAQLSSDSLPALAKRSRHQTEP